MPQGIHPQRHQRGRDPRAAHHLLRILILGGSVAAGLLELVACDAQVPVAVTGGGDAPQVLESSPADGDEEVARSLELRARFDRALDPDTVHRSSVRLGSGPDGVFLSLRVDPIDRSIVATPFRGRLLEPGVVYRWVIEGVRDLDGTVMEPWEGRFRTGAAAGDAPPPEPAAPWDDVARLLGTRCAAMPGCHGAESRALGLDLSSADGVRRTALAVASQQVSAGGSAPEGKTTGSGLVGMPIIDVLGDQGRPETSYLMYKVLGDPHIVGESMPPEATLSTDEIGWLSRWIRHGARIE